MSRIPDEPESGFLSEAIPFEYTVAIGEVVSKWAILEHAIDEAIWDFAGLYDSPKIGACLTAQYSSVAARFNALISLARLRGVDDFQISKLSKYKEHVLGIAERRNRVAHDPWLTLIDYKTIRADKTYRLHKTARAKLDYALKPIEISELKALSEEIDKTIAAFSELGLTPTIAPYEIR